MDEKLAKELLEKVKNDYNLIAEDYTRSRAFIPEDIIALAKYTNSREKVLDLGCGNGRLFQVLEEKKIDFFGVDVSERLIEIGKKKYPQAKFQIADALNLPFSENYFDKIYCLSVLHHLPSKKFRRQFLKEAERVLRPAGLLILRVWDFWRRKSGWKLFLKYTFLKMAGKTRLDFFDVFMPWKDSQGKLVLERYFHCFTKSELEGLVKQAGFKIKKSWRAGGDPRTNIYLIAEK